VKFFLFIFSFLISTVFASSVSAQEITHFNSDITINTDASINITETLDFTTPVDRHGIFRYIPYRYNIESQNDPFTNVINNFFYPLTDLGSKFTAEISEITVTGPQGDPLEFQQSRESGNVVLKIGDPNTTFTGDKTYIISYRVENALRRFDTHDELFWDITGEGWQIPIRSTQATINSPHARIVKISCYSGAVGTDDGLCHESLLEPNQAIFTYDQTISYDHNLTIAVGLEQASTALVFPTPWQRFQKFLLKNILVLPTLLPIVVMFYLWYTKGRDRQFLSANIFDNDPQRPTRLQPLFDYSRTPMVYQPLTHLTPGEAGTIVDEKVDNQDVIAEIIDLARRGYLTIKAETTKKLGLFTSKDYTFKKKRSDYSTLPPQQEYLMTQIFKTGDTVKLSKLKGSFYSAMAKTKTLIYQSVHSKGLFTGNPQTVKTVSLLIALLLMGVSFFVSVPQLSNDNYLPFILTLLQAPIVLFFAFNMVQKTATGYNYSLQAKGLKSTIKTGAWRQKINERNLFVEEVLPFAISLGVVDQLTRDMKDLNLKPPSYFAATGTRSFTTDAFVRDFSSKAQSSLSYNPSSSSYSGGSGFSGGSSGGGGGGGGGGSW